MVRVSNGTGMAVETLELRVGERVVARSALGAGAVDRYSVGLRQEGPVTLDLRFENGHHAELPAGWYSPGGSDAARIRIVTPDSLRTHAW